MVNVNRSALLSALLALVGGLTADSYIGRLPQHQGFYLVPVADAVPHAPARPRHTVVIVVDGLRADRAAQLHATARLRAAGQCRPTDLGPLTVSRPIYAVLSTGLEQDRTGARNNDETRPLRAESLWQVARRAGLVVTGASELPWFQQLFPDGFDRYRLVPRPADAFTPADLGDLSLIHPVYIDEAGHDHGAASPAYAAAVARLDEELGRLLDRLDLALDLVVLTADHGHTDRGGHGGLAKEVSTVLTCLAGRGVMARTERLPQSFDMRALAPTLSVLLGVPFPRHMRAGDDPLDVMWEIVDAAVYPADYLLQRRAALQRFRAENTAQLHDLGVPSWPALYAKGRRAQAVRAVLCGALLLLLVVLRRRRRTPAFLSWLLGQALVLVALFVLVRGSFDVNAINKRLPFILWTSGLTLPVALLASAAHLMLWRDVRRTAADQLLLAGVLGGVCAAHVVVFGWPLGFPLPGRIAFFLPFFVGIVLLWQGLLSLALFLSANGMVKMRK